MVENTRAAAFTGTMLPTKSFTSRGVVTTAAMVLTLVIRTAEAPLIFSAMLGLQSCSLVQDSQAEDANVCKKIKGTLALYALYASLHFLCVIDSPSLACSN